MKPRSVAHFLRDVTASKSAQRWYRHRAAMLREQAKVEEAAGKPLTARVTRYRALVAEHAAQAEFMDPEVPA